MCTSPVGLWLTQEGPASARVMGQRGEKGSWVQTVGRAQCHLTGGSCPPRAHEEGSETEQRWQQVPSTLPKHPTSTQR